MQNVLYVHINKDMYNVFLLLISYKVTIVTKVISHLYYSKTPLLVPKLY